MIFTISIKFLKRKFDNKMTCIKKGKDKIQFDENKKCNFIVLKPPFPFLGEETFYCR